MNIIKAKRKSKCGLCWGEIKGKYKVDNNQQNYFHLSCFKKYSDRQLRLWKDRLKELNKQKYKKYMILEKLE